MTIETCQGRPAPTLRALPGTGTAWSARGLGLNAVRELADADVDVTLVDRPTTTCSGPCSTRSRRASIAGLIAPGAAASSRSRTTSACRWPTHTLDLDAKVVHAKGPTTARSTCPTTP